MAGSGEDVKIYRKSDLTPEISLTGQVPQEQVPDIEQAIEEFYETSAAEIDAAIDIMDRVLDWFQDEEYRKTIEDIEGLALNLFDPTTPWNRDREALGEIHYEDTIEEDLVAETVANHYGIAYSNDAILRFDTTAYNYKTDGENDITDYGVYVELMSTVPQPAKLSMMKQTNGDQLEAAVEESTGSAVIAAKTKTLNSKLNQMATESNQDVAAIKKSLGYMGGTPEVIGALAYHIRQGGNLVRDMTNLVQDFNNIPNLINQNLQLAIPGADIFGPLCSMLDLLVGIGLSLSAITGALAGLVNSLNQLLDGILAISMPGWSFPNINFGIDLPSIC